MRKILRNFYINIFGFVNKPKPGVHIINSHFVRSDELNLKLDLKIFEEYLQYLKKFSDFVTLEEAVNKINNSKMLENKILLAFTFDDGFEECYTVIAPLLEKYNCRGAFFVNANYIESDETYQLGFNERTKTYTKKPMTWLQVIDLHKRGHLIGSHNLDHADFGLLSNNEIEFQLSENKRILEEKLNYECDYFAWTYGQFKNFPENALKITQKYHPYIFSGTNYKFYKSYNGEVINRRHMEAYWPKLHINFFLSIEKK